VCSSDLTAENDLCVILEVDLHYFVAKSEHDGMPSPHPLLNIDGRASRLIVGIYNLSSGLLSGDLSIFG
jgi:hypothetical protein